MRSDEQLARAIQQGGKAELTILVERYYDAILRYAYRLCGGQQTIAEEMTQETFLRLLKNSQQYQYPRPFKPWLYTITTNIARNYFNRAETRRTEADDQLDEYPDDDDHHPDYLLQSQDTAEQVLLALAELPDHQREVVVLFYYEMLPQKDIAEMLTIPVGTVKSRLSLGLKQLRELLKERELDGTR